MISIFKISAALYTISNTYNIIYNIVLIINGQNKSQTSSFLRTICPLRLRVGSSLYKCAITAFFIVNFTSTFGLIWCSRRNLAVSERLVNFLIYHNSFNVTCYHYFSSSTICFEIYILRRFTFGEPCLPHYYDMHVSVSFFNRRFINTNTANMKKSDGQIQ